ncbi:MAG: hypothetical protein CSA53_07655, partial [Gammaproteobacteria bacterium]
MSAAAIMYRVMLATLPGVLLLLFFWGIGIGIQLLLAALTALVCEALNAKLRQRSLTALDVASGLLSALLLAIALPATAPWWVVVSGTGFGLLIGKHIFGGVGMNIFNPAMVGFCAVYFSFPAAMSSYPGDYVPVAEVLAAIFPGAFKATVSPDALAAATTLTQFKIDGQWAGISSKTWLINLAWLAGGAYLWHKHVADWRLSAGFLGGFFAAALLFWLSGYASLNPLQHAGAGALLFTACFIVTDPTTAATGRLGRWLFALLAGVLALLIRQFSHMADSMAFAILLANTCAPLIDSYTRPQYFRGQR